jgi:hypothetical protein
MVFFIAMLVSNVLYASEQVAYISVGDGMIAIPIPQGFKEGEITEQVRLFWESSNPQTRLVAGFHEEGSNDKPAYLQVAVFRKLESEVVTLEQFERLVKSPAKAQYLQLTNDAEKKANSSIQNMISDNRFELLKGLRQLNMTLIPSGLISEGRDFLSYGNITLMATKGTDPSDVSMMAGSLTIMFLNGKVIFVYAYADYQGKPTIDWLNQLTPQWVNDIRRANQNVIYALVGTTRITLPIPEGFRAANVPDEFRRVNKSAGSRVLALFEKSTSGTPYAYRNMSVLVLESTERQPFSMNEFQQYKSTLKSNADRLETEAEEFVNKEIPSGNTVRRQSLRFFSESDAHLSYKKMFSLPPRDSEPAMKTIGTMTSLFVKGRVLYLNVNANYQGNPPVMWIDESTKKWVTDILQANP